MVNISATQTIEEKGGGAMPNLPKGTPFDEMFEEFFKNHGVTPRPRAQKAQSLGSGFVIDPSGIVITNNHVVGDANDIVVIFNDGRKLKAKVIGKDSKVDVAVLKVESDKPLKTVKFGDSDKARVGDGVMAVGNPFGLGETVTAGIVSARNRNIDSGPYDDFLQTDASINKGNSGGPLFNLQGEVIGINTAILSPSGGSIGIGFATPSATVQPVIAQLEQFHETRRGWLGVRIQPVDDTIAESLNLGTARGALVAGVDDKGPAKPAGLKAGDVIVKFDGKDIKESRDLPRIVASTPVGKAVDVVVVRNGKEVTKSVTLGRLEDGEKTAEVASNEETPVRRPTSSRRRSAWSSPGITDDVRKSFKIKESVKGVVVTSVEPGSPAADRGLQARRRDRGGQPPGGRQAGRPHEGARRREEGGRQEAGAAAGRQRRGHGALRRRPGRVRPASVDGTAPSARADNALAMARAVLERAPLFDGHNDLPWVIRIDKAARGESSPTD